MAGSRVAVARGNRTPGAGFPEGKAGRALAQLPSSPFFRRPYESLRWTPSSGDGQQGVRQEGQGDMPVPTGPAADFIMVKTYLAFSPLEPFFHRPASPGDRHQFRQGGIRRIEGHIIGALDRSRDPCRRTRNQVPQALSVGGQKAPSYSRGPFGPGPALRRRQAVLDKASVNSAIVIRPNLQDIRDALRLQPAPEGAIFAVDFSR